MHYLFVIARALSGDRRAMTGEDLRDDLHWMLGLEGDGAREQFPHDHSERVNGTFG